MLCAALQQTNVIENHDEVPGPSNVDTRGNEDTETDVDPVSWGVEEQFRQAQVADPMLTKVREELAISEGQVLDTRRAGRTPRFVKEGGVLWRVMGPGKRGGTPG